MIKKMVFAFILILLVLSFSTPAYAVNPCEQCINTCGRQYERNIDRCELLGHGLAGEACILTAEERYNTCIEECFIEYDHDCDEFVDPGGGGGGLCHYEVETGRCVPYR